MPFGQVELQDANRHEECGGSKAGAQSPKHLRLSRHQRSQETTDIDADVEDGEAGIQARAAFRIKVRNNRADIGLEQPHAEHDHRQSNIEAARAARGREQGVAEGDGNTPGHHGTLRADQAVRDPAAGQRRQVNSRVVQAVNSRGGFVIQAESAVGHRVDEEQHQQGTHAVEGESLPHFGHEQRGEAARLTQEGGAQITFRLRVEPVRLPLSRVPLFFL